MSRTSIVEVSAELFAVYTFLYSTSGLIDATINFSKRERKFRLSSFREFDLDSACLSSQSSVETNRPRTKYRRRTLKQELTNDKLY